MSYDVRFLKGTSERYKALPAKDKNTFYYVDESQLYLGEILLSNADEVKAAVASIELNAQAIKTLQDELDALVDPEGTGGGSISTQINTLRQELNAAILANGDAIREEVSRAKGVESGLRTDVDKVSGDLATLSATVSANEEDIEGKVSALSTTVQGTSDAVGAISITVGEHAGKISGLEGDIEDLIGDVDAVETAIATLVGSDEEKSVRAIAAEELAAKLIPAEAQESLDTLQEIAAWIQGHPKDVADINQAITALQATSATHTDNITTLQEAVAAINNAESGILAQANAYADGKVDALTTIVNNNNSATEKAIEDLEGAIADINDEDTGILAQAELAIENAIQELGLGSAAYESKDAFEVAGAADAALEAAKAYTNEALTWGVIPAVEA
jgi:chromosome segregation ATPase